LARYVLKHRGSEPPREEVELIERSSGLTVLDRSAPRALLVEAPEETARALRERLPGWTVAEERTYPPPGPARERIRGEDPGESR
jgi:hypothetical protein